VNVCKAGINSVKFETVRYSLTLNSSAQNAEKTKAEYQKLISSVKCKSKQISLIFKKVDQLSISCRSFRTLLMSLKGFTNFLWQMN
jgi:hypothetical protein